MNKTAICFFTKDRVELSRRTIEPLLRILAADGGFDLWWFDGSDTPAGEQFMLDSMGSGRFCRSNVRGGPDAAVVYALTTALAHPAKYTHIGFVENDVLLDPDWFPQTMDLFETGTREGLEVGAVSARCYADRILCQRDGYALVHNLGWGTQIMTRQAATLALRNIRTSWTLENRRTFSQLSGLDIGSSWAFRTAEHHLCADWGNDRILAASGLASLALTPTLVSMIGQTPSLADQGLTLVHEPVEARRDDKAFDRFVMNTALIRSGLLKIPGCDPWFHADDGIIIFAHFFRTLPGFELSGDWRHKFAQGFGPFAMRGLVDASITLELSGPVKFMLSGGPKGGQAQVEDLKSGYVVRPTLNPEVDGNILQAVVPASVSTRRVRVTVLKGEVVLYGVHCREPQAQAQGWVFEHSALPSI